MKKTKIIFLGCGSSTGVPRIDGFWGNCNKQNRKNIRTRCSLFIAKGKNKIVVDASPDIKSQFLRNGIKDLPIFFISHHHADATSGLPELRPLYFKYGKKIKIYSNKETISKLRKTYRYCFEPIMGYKPFLVSKKIKNGLTLGRDKSEKLSFKFMSVLHGRVKSLGFVFEKFAYISDCNKLSSRDMWKLKNLKYLAIDCLRIKKHPSHFCLNEALQVIKKLKPNKAILTNLHHGLDYNFLLKILPKNVKPAYDGMNIIL